MRVNELYDDENQRDNNPNLDKSSFRSVIHNLNNPISTFFKKISYAIPVLETCVYDEDDNHFVLSKDDIFTFIIRNNTFHTSLSIYFRSVSSVDLCIAYQKLEYRGNDRVEDILTGGIEDCLYIECHEEQNIDETIDILKNRFLAMLKNLGFKEYLSNKRSNSQRLN